MFVPRGSAKQKEQVHGIHLYVAIKKYGNAESLQTREGSEKWTQKGENQGVLVLLVNFRVTHLLIHHLKLLRGPRIVAHELRTIFLQVILMQRRIRMRYGNDESFKLKIKNLKFKPYVCGN